MKFFTQRRRTHGVAKMPGHGRIARTIGAVSLVGTLGLTGCSIPGTADQGEATKLRVVTTTTQLTDFAGEIGGDDIELRGLLKPGASAHHYDPTPADLLALAQADVLVVNGFGLESFIDSAIESSGFSGEIVTAADGVAIDETESAEHEHEHEHDDHGAHDHAEHDHEHAEHEHDDHAEHDHAEHEHDHADHDHEAESGGSHDGHDHGAVNPHIWTSPDNARGMAAAIASGLEHADPAHAAAYEARAAAFDARLVALDTWAAEQFAAVPAAQRVFVSGHDSMHYYLEAYGIAFGGAILPSFEDNAEPSAAELDALIDTIKRKNVSAIFVESSMSPKLARTIARESGARVIDSDAIYADALGASGSGAETYIDATAHNTRVILEAWGFEAQQLPEEAK